MSRIGHYIVNALTGLSLLLCVMVALPCSVDLVTPWHEYGVVSSNGELLLHDCRNNFVAAENGRGFHYEVDEAGDLPASIQGMRHWGAAGFFVLAQERGGPSTCTMKGVILPFWFVITASTLLPLRWQLKQWKSKRRMPGFCRVCGYDLRATPDRCPECGTIPTKRPE